MTRRLFWITVWAVLTAPLWAAAANLPPGSISGTVRSSSGAFQMGARIEVFAGSLTPVATTFTNGKGFFETQGLEPGTYRVKVSAPAFLPLFSDDIGLSAGANLVINVTLRTLFDAIRMLPEQRRTTQDDEDWKWVLRSTSSRPILRLLDDDALTGGSRTAGSQPGHGDRPIKAQVAFLAGSDAGGFGSSPDQTTFMLERSLFAAGTLAFGGGVGYGAGITPASTLLASYSHRLADGSEPHVTFSMHRLTGPSFADRDTGLQVLALSASDKISVAGLIDLYFGSDYESIQFLGQASAVRPFGSVDVHLSPNTVIGYRYATSEPDTQEMKSFDSGAAGLSDPEGRVSLRNSAPVLESARHQEVSLSRRLGDNNIQVAWYWDRLSNPALTGVGNVAAGGEFLPDFYSGTFTWTGSQLRTNGVRLVVQHKLSPNLTGSLDYSYGGVLALDNGWVNWPDVRSEITTERRHALGCKLTGVIPASHTRWIASYRWMSGSYALTAVDIFNDSAGQADPYLNIFIRQPIPGSGFVPGHMEMLVDVRNLLAQGYVPVAGDAGRTLYLVQTARAIRGGLAFTF